MSRRNVVLGLFMVVAAAGAAGAQGRGNAAIRFKEMDRSGDNVISRAEWRGSDRSFEVHDWNGDGRLAGDEVRVGAARKRAKEPVLDSADQEFVYDDWTDRGFRALDHNKDARITADEWHFDRESYRRADHNRDGIVSRTEFLNEAAEDDDRDFSGAAPAVNQTAAYRTGYEKGTTEGRNAGREERLNNRAWDLEGQSELDAADSGYQPGMGPKAEYQAGYRAGFRRAYREGWDQAK